MRRFASLCVSVFLGVCAAVPSTAADAKLLIEAGKALESCGESMPNTRALGKNLKSKGFKYQGFYSGLDIYSIYNDRVVIGTSFTSSPDKRCIIVVSKMTVPEISLVVAPWVMANKAKEFDRPGKKPNKYWKGKFWNNRPVHIGYLDNVNLGVVYGAAIIVAELAP
jgi:hypothetical protein